MKITLRIGIGFLVLYALITLVGYLLPRYATMARSRVIHAPKEAIATQIGELHNWPNWNPWDKKDGSMTVQYSTPSQGPGAWYAWTSTDESVGDGKLTLTSVSPDSIGNAMVFMGRDTASAVFRFTPVSDGTNVEWTLRTDMGAGPYGRWFGLLLPSMVGPDYDLGLANLAKITEGK
jgi:hypothetical protein